jgi:hypothetical protein
VVLQLQPSPTPPSQWKVTIEPFRVEVEAPRD